MKPLAAPANASPPHIAVHGLQKRFGAGLALAELSFSVAPGEIVGLLGPNGAGKTTCLKLMMGLLRPSAGRAEILGLDCSSRSAEVKAQVGYCPDEPSFYDFLSGAETLAFVARVRGLDAARAREQIAPLVRRLSFVSELDALTHTYSHGMKKKLALLCACLHQPPVLLLDEPTNGLDPQAAHEVREYLGELAVQGVAVLISTHLLDMADRLCSRLLILDRGRVVAMGTAAGVRELAGVDAGATLEDAYLRLCA